LGPPVQITSLNVRGLFAYWDRIRGDRLAPNWAEIDPAAIRPCLPYLLVSEILGEPADLRYRLVGTEIVSSYGYDLTGRTLQELAPAPINAMSIILYCRLFEERRPVFGRYIREVCRNESLHVDTAIFPLSEDGRTINRILEIEDWGMAPGIRRGRTALCAWRFETLS
jgi:hypothetical protein